jgi:hypothetical protein
MDVHRQESIRSVLTLGRNLDSLAQYIEVLRMQQSRTVIEYFGRNFQLAAAERAYADLSSRVRFMMESLLRNRSKYEVQCQMFGALQQQENDEVVRYLFDILEPCNSPHLSPSHPIMQVSL